MAAQQFPEPTVGGLIFNPENKLFFMSSHKWKGKYVIPGGHIELGESIEQALIREVKEDTNLDIYALEYIFFQEFIHDETFWKKRHYIFFDYACKTDSTEVILNSEAQEYVWIDLNEIGKYPIESYTLKTIEKYLLMGGKR